MTWRAGEFWPAFCQAVGKCNAFRRHGVLRQYQEQILEHGTFEVISPFTGMRLPAAYSTRIGSRIAYAFECVERFWVSTEAFRFGHPLSIFVQEHTGDCQRIQVRENNQELRTAGLAGRLRQEKFRATVSEAHAGTLLLIGHPNFAHHLWNELSALDEWLAGTSDETIRKLKLLPTAEPLGPLLEIFPRLQLATFVRDTERLRAEQDSMIVRVGSRIVTNRVRRIVSEYSHRCADRAKLDHVLRTLGSGWPRIWISLRLNSRTAENQDEFLIMVIRRIFRIFPEAVIVFDGFSYPIGFFDDVRMKPFHDEFVSRGTLTGQAIEGLMRRAAAELGHAGASRLCSISGCSLSDAVYVGTYCDYYICHAGTLQHKIAWLHNIPGFIHSPSQGKQFQDWYAYQVQDGISPDFLPAECLKGSSVGHNKRNVSRNNNYIITDIERSSDIIVQSMQRSLGELCG